MRCLHRVVAGAMLCALLVAGCGPAEVPRATLSGKISYGGKPLPSGTVSLIVGSTVASGPIKDGQYTIERAPVGAAKIGVVTPMIATNSQQMQMKQKVEGKSFSGEVVQPVPIPNKYNNPD